MQTMMLLRTGRILCPSLLPKITTFAASVPLLKFSTSSSPSSSVPLINSDFCIKGYLISTCYLSPQQAARASKFITHISSPEKPDSVRHFLKHHVGSSDANIRSIISSYPHILTADVEKTLQPNLHSLRQVGFSDADLRKLVTRNVRVLFSPSSIPRILFWKSFLNNDMKKLALALYTNRGLINQNIGAAIALKVSFLKGRGVSDADISRILLMGGGFFSRSISSMSIVLNKAQELGFHPSSRMFVHGIRILTCLSSDTIREKMDIFKGYGWSEGEVNSIMEKIPALLGLSEGNIRMKMKFLVDMVGCKLSYIACYPRLLAFSLEKRLMPRLQVMKTLYSNGLVSRELNLLTIMGYPEKIFLEKFVLPHIEVAPKLHEIYLAARKGQRVLNVDG